MNCVSLLTMSSTDEQRCNLIKILCQNNPVPGNKFCVCGFFFAMRVYGDPENGVPRDLLEWVAWGGTSKEWRFQNQLRDLRFHDSHAKSFPLFRQSSSSFFLPNPPTPIILYVVCQKEHAEMNKKVFMSRRSLFSHTLHPTSCHSKLRPRLTIQDTTSLRVRVRIVR